MSNSKMFTIDKFLGVNQSADSTRELKMGQASEACNFAITDGGNITTRPGLVRAYAIADVEPRVIWSGRLGVNSYMIIGASNANESAYTFRLLRCMDDDSFQELYTLNRPGGLGLKVFSFGGDIYIFSGLSMVRLEIDETVNPPAVRSVVENGYVPLILTGCAPAGGGTILEALNILADKGRVQYSSDGAATAYVLPDAATDVDAITVDGTALAVADVGSFDAAKHTFTFKTAPVKGVNNVEFTISCPSDDITAARKKFFAMPYFEAYNGNADNRLFFYGDGSNVTYYTGITENGKPSALYIPAGNEIVVDMSDSPITGMTRHYSKLLIYKPDCTASISYEPMTLEDGSVIAGFTMHTIHKSAGNEAPGQVRICGNYPRSIGDNHLYEWRVPSSYYADERYAKVMSAPVRDSLAAADASRIVTCCDNSTSTYYLFLNDPEGTVLVNRYALEVWTIYKSRLLTNVVSAVMHGTKMVILAQTEAGGTTYTNCLCWDESARYDACVSGADALDPVAAPDTDAPIPIFAEWRTGYMDFGADYLKKYSSDIWVSLLPQTSSKVTVTAATDRQDDYADKHVGSNLFSYDAVDYAHWSYNFSRAPKIEKVRLKVKKFVYYMLIFRVDEPGAQGTILSFDQLVRYGSYVK